MKYILFVLILLISILVEKNVVKGGDCTEYCGTTIQCLTLLDGSYLCFCDIGTQIFNPVSQTCDDVNECSSNNGGCSDVCNNHNNGFTCSCNSGRALSGDGKTCVIIEVNECSNNNGGCSDTCTDTTTSYYCSCPNGYSLSGNGKTCIVDEVNECSVNNGGCSDTCTDTTTSYYCSCPNGYSLSGNGKTCIVDEVNECLYNNGGCSDTCIDTTTSYYCSCPNGYSLSGNGKTCESDSINECEDQNGGCSDTCTNTPGGYYCSCPSGFSLASNGKTCEDINECLDPNACPNYPLCTNLIGSFNCSGDFVHFITSVYPTTVNGGNASFIGKFGELHNNILLEIGGINCPITFISPTIINCTASPNQGVLKVNLTQNGISSFSWYHYQPLGESKCLNNCTNESHGICNVVTGECNCKQGFDSFDCSIKLTNNSSNTNVTVENGSTNLNNQETKFQIYVKALNELDFDGKIVKSYKLQEKWVLNSSIVDTDGNSKFIFTQKLNNSKCIVKTTIEEIEKEKVYTFAGTTFSVKKGQAKFTISIYNYAYLSFLNTIQLEIFSFAGELENEDYDNECNKQDTQVEIDQEDESSPFNYIKISKNNKILNARFLNRLLSDGHPSFLSTSIRNNVIDNSVSVYFDLPHCVDECSIDPDFSVIVSPQFNPNCNNDDSNRKWVIPVAVVVSVVGAALIAIGIFILKKNTTIRIGVAKLKRFNKQ